MLRKTFVASRRWLFSSDQDWVFLFLWSIFPSWFQYCFFSVPGVFVLFPGSHYDYWSSHYTENVSVWLAQFLFNYFVQCLRLPLLSLPLLPRGIINNGLFWCYLCSYCFRALRLMKLLFTNILPASVVDCVLHFLRQTDILDMEMS